MVQGLDSPAYLLPGMPQNSQLSSTSVSVITLGHMPNVPLMRARSELSYGLEPHDIVLLHGRTVRCPVHCQDGARGVPGVCGPGGYQGGAIPGTTQPVDLRLISMNY